MLKIVVIIKYKIKILIEAIYVDLFFRAQEPQNMIQLRTFYNIQYTTFNKKK